jgi:hypothetical protein
VGVKILAAVLVEASATAAHGDQILVGYELNEEISDNEF